METRYADTGGYIKFSPSTPDPLAENKKAEYLEHWKVVKRARFNAAKRLERKHRASTMAFVIAAIIGFLSMPFELLFDHSLTPITKRIFQFSAYVTGVLSLTLGLIEQARNYPGRARRFDLCAKNVNAIIRDLETTPMRELENLKPFIKRYEMALEEYEENHDDLDYEIAQATSNLDHAEHRDRPVHQKKLFRLRVVEHAHIYFIHVLTWVLPIFIGFIIWLFIAGGDIRPPAETAEIRPDKTVVEVPIEPGPPTASISKPEKAKEYRLEMPLNLPF